MSLGDAIDRVTILIRKIEFGEHKAYKEFEHLTQAIDKLKLPLSGAMLASVIRISYANFEVWNRENLFRRANETELQGMPAEEVKKMMIEVREYNSKRIYEKNEINRQTEMGFREFKTHHRSK